MTEYVYRVDAQSALENISDNTFRARRWGTENGFSFPHKLLNRIHSNLPSTVAVYRICFFTTEAKAEQAIRSYGQLPGVSHLLLRCHKDQVLASGFDESWDDGFSKGEAYLFWVSETLSSANAEFSCSGIAIDHFQIRIDGQWQSLQSHFVQIATAR
jgi:hypothetical protein